MFGGFLIIFSQSLGQKELSKNRKEKTEGCGKKPKAGF